MEREKYLVRELCYKLLVNESNRSLPARIYNKGMKTLFSFLVMLQYRLQGKGKSEAPFRDDTVISLTSYSDRFSAVYYTILSLMKQSLRCRIILWVSGDERHDRMLKRILKIQDDCFSVRFCEDLKSYKKFFFTGSEMREKTIITVDDDVIYSRDFVERLSATHALFPDNVICYRGKRMSFTGGIPCNYNSWKVVYPEKEAVTSKRIMPIGMGGVLYPPFFFDDSVLSKNFLTIAPFGDDIWLKMSAVRKGIKTTVIPSKISNWIGIPFSQRKALFKGNVGNSRNEEYLKNVSAYFRLTECDYND